MLATLAAPHPDSGHAVDRTAPFLWYTLSVIPQSQARVCQRAREIGITTYVPMSRTPPALCKFGRQRVAEAEVRPLMPGYVFVSLPSLNAQFGIFDPRHGSEALRGSLGFISCEQGPESQRWPMAVSEAVISNMRAREAAGEFDLTGKTDNGRGFVAKWVRIGAWVEIVDGPFADRSGVIEEVLSSTLIKVGMHIFGSVTPITAPLDWLRLARTEDHGILISKKNRAMRRTWSRENGTTV